MQAEDFLEGAKTSPGVVKDKVADSAVYPGAKAVCGSDKMEMDSEEGFQEVGDMIWRMEMNA